MKLLCKISFCANNIKYCHFLFRTEITPRIIVYLFNGFICLIFHPYVHYSFNFNDVLKEHKCHLFSGTASILCNCILLGFYGKAGLFLLCTCSLCPLSLRGWDWKSHTMIISKYSPVTIHFPRERRGWSPRLFNGIWERGPPASSFILSSTTANVLTWM